MKIVQHEHPLLPDPRPLRYSNSANNIDNTVLTLDHYTILTLCELQMKGITKKLSNPRNYEYKTQPTNKSRYFIVFYLPFQCSVSTKTVLLYLRHTAKDTFQNVSYCQDKVQF